MEDRHLFRGKRIDNGEWIYGNLIQTPNSNRNWITSETTDKTRLRSISKYYADWRSYEVDPSTICQCTGLKDKNGKLIWENDIVQVRYTDGQEVHQEIVNVSYSKHGFVPFAWEYECDGCDLRCEIIELEVIGNVFDNPELLEVQK